MNLGGIGDMNSIVITVKEGEQVRKIELAPIACNRFGILYVSQKDSKIFFKGNNKKAFIANILKDLDSERMDDRFAAMIVEAYLENFDEIML